jgi:lantibiotic biosynthesis protein
MINDIPYVPFDRFVVRTPLLHFGFGQRLAQDSGALDTRLREACSSPLIREAILLASPDLYSQVQMWLRGELTDEKKMERLHQSLLRYLIRMSFRSTPFGLLAGVSVGRWEQNSCIRLSEPGQHRRHTRLDMNYLCALAQDLIRDPNIRSSVRYFPNTSLYTAGSQVRYVEYRYSGNLRTHHIVAVDRSEALETVLRFVAGGARRDKVAESLVEEDVSMDAALAFVDELIDIQILVSELQPTITGPEFLEQLLDVLSGVPQVEHLRRVLLDVKATLSTIDRSPLGSTENTYHKLGEQLKKIGTPFEFKFLVQVDLIKSTMNCTLDRRIADDILQALCIMVRMSAALPNLRLKRFCEALTERYESEEVPVATALDTEMGVGYANNASANSCDPLIDDIVIPQSGAGTDIHWDRVESFLLGKYLDAIQKGIYEVELRDDELKMFEPNWDDIPDTLAGFARIVQSSNGQRVHIQSLGGSSAANLLGRFCHADAEIHSFVSEICECEQRLAGDALLAEIVHLPESRVGNILLRPVLRNHEIPYLARAGARPDHQIPLGDLVVTAHAGRVHLRSKKLNKEIIPRLTTAHNYSNNSLPIYQFLCDIQAQQQRANVSFSWGVLNSEFRFCPRVVYKNIILSLASWRVNSNELRGVSGSSDSHARLALMDSWRTGRNIPRLVVFVEGDNELCIDLGSETGIDCLLYATRKKSRFQLHEFLFQEADEIVQNGDGSFTHEVVVAFHRRGEKHGESIKSN